MTLNDESLMSYPFEPIEKAYAHKDSILYALGIGVGTDPNDERQLRFLYEQDLQAMPTMAVVLGYPGLYLKDPSIGVDWKQVVHGEQSLVVHARLPASGRIVATNNVEEVLDKGPGRGAVVYSKREIREAASGDLIATLTATAFCRADGGFGGVAGPVKAVNNLPDRRPDVIVDVPTLAQAALLYRLSGDSNPLHVDPQVAAAAGFRRPLLHGLCTFGIAGHVLLREVCDYRPERFIGLDARFSEPVFPGDVIQIAIWDDGPGRASFQCRVVDRNAIVVNNGLYEFRT